MEGIEEIDGAYTQVSAVAKQIGMANNFKGAFKLLSKFSHPTAMRMLGVVGEDQIRRQRECFFSLVCLHFTGAFTALEGLLLPLSNEGRGAADRG